MYTLERAAGDNMGVGLLVHDVQDSSGTNPLGNLPASESSGVDPDNFAASAVGIPQTGTPGSINFSNPMGSGQEAMAAGKFIDLTATPNFSAASVITCAGLGTDGLTGCTAPDGGGGISVSQGDVIEQVIATSSAVTVPSGPEHDQRGRRSRHRHGDGDEPEQLDDGHGQPERTQPPLHRRPGRVLRPVERVARRTRSRTARPVPTARRWR